MSVVKLFEPYSIDLLRRQVRESLMYHGEQAVALQLVHTIPDPDGSIPDPDVKRCPRCTDDIYQDGEARCPVCYGVSFIDSTTGTGVKLARRVWALFGDHVINEELAKRGVWNHDEREIQLEAFPALIERDVVVRVRWWDDTTHTAMTEGQFYGMGPVTRSSVRTGGSRYSQNRDDIYGQKANCSLLSRSVGITDFPIKGVSFPEFTIVGTPTPTVVAMPDQKVIYVPGNDGSTPAPNSGSVLGAALEWKAVFTFAQDVPATPWTVTHSLDHDPQVSIYVGGELVAADVDIVNPTTFTITFAEPQSGYAEIS